MSELNEATISTTDSHIPVALQCEKLDEEHTQDLQAKVSAAADQSPPECSGLAQREALSAGERPAQQASSVCAVSEALRTQSR